MSVEHDEPALDAAGERPRPVAPAVPLRVGPVDDPAEREADHVAGAVSRALRTNLPASASTGKVRRSPATMPAAADAGGPASGVQIRPTSDRVIRRQPPNTAVAQGISGADFRQADTIARELEAEARKRLGDYYFRGLGGGGAKWWRSKEVRRFRQALKNAARTQAYQDFDVAVGKSKGGKGKSATGDFQELVGANLVYDDAKESVDTVLRDITDSLLAGPAVGSHFSGLADQARDAAERSFATDPGDVEEARSAAEEAIERVEAELKKRFRKNKGAVTGKLDGDGERTKDDWSMTAMGQHVSNKVVDQVKSDEIGRKALERAIDTDSMSKGLIVLGKIIDGILTAPGEVLELAIEFRIPVTTGVVVILKLEGLAARGVDGATTAGVTMLGDPNRVEVSAKFSVGAGAEAIGASADGTVGFFVRAGSDKGSRAALQALSYGAYRASGKKTVFGKEVGTEAVQNLWAPPDKRGEVDGTKARSKRELAETWAAMVEENYFDGDDTFAHVGMGVDGSVALNAGVAEFGIGFGDSLFSKYDRESLAGPKGSLGKSFGTSLGKKPEDREKEAKRRRKAATGAAGFSAYLSFAAAFDAAGLRFEVGASGSGTDPANWGIEATFGLTTPADAATPAVADTIVNGYVASFGELLQKLGSLQSEQSSDNLLGKIGQLPASGAAMIDAGTKQGLTSAIKGIGSTEVAKSGTDIALGGSAKDSAGQSLMKTMETVAVSSMMMFVVTFGRNNGKWVVRVELRLKRGIDIGNSATVAKFSGSKSTRLFAGGKDADGAVLEVAGARFV